jgi:PAS domain S-box-containing protein
VNDVMLRDKPLSPSAFRHVIAVPTDIADWMFDLPEPDWDLPPAPGRAQRTASLAARLAARTTLARHGQPGEAAGPRDVAALAAAEERYRALVRATSSLVWTTPADGRVVDMPEWRAYTGLPIEQIRGRAWVGALHPEDRERAAAAWQRAVDTQSLYETEYRIRRRDGSHVWHRARGVPILEADGAVREWVGVCLDIDRQKRAEEKRLAAEAELRRLNEVLEQRVEAEARERARIWNVSQDMLAVTDGEGRFLSLNPAWSTSLGWSEAELLGNDFDRLVHPDDRERSRAALPLLADGRTPRQLENRLRHKDGSFRWLSWTAVRDGARIYAVARDVTATKAAEEELRASRQELARVSRQLTMGVITASIAHEICQPLAAIVVNGQVGQRWLARETPNLPEAAAALDRVVRDAQRAGQVIDTVRSMFKNGAQEKAPLEVNELLRDTLDLLQAEFRRHDIVVKHELAAGLPRAQVDRVQLQQVVLNLAMNAIEAMSTVTDRPRTLRIVSARHEPGGVAITVEDSGPGIDPADAARIFDPFFTTKADGMGLGLSICRSIVEGHRGRLTAAPAGPYGTAFQVTLPAGA